MLASPYRTQERPVTLDEETDVSSPVDPFFLVVAIVWVTAALRVLGALFAAANRGQAFGAEATLALAAVIAASMALLRGRVRG